MSGAVWYNLVAIGILQSISAVRIKLPVWIQATTFHVLGTLCPFLYTAGLAMAEEINPSGGYGVCFLSATKVRWTLSGVGVVVWKRGRRYWIDSHSHR